MGFRDRADAGRQLGEKLGDLGVVDAVVLGLPRGGVPVAIAVAERVGGTVDVLVARKVGAPGQPEFGIGAISEGDATVVNRPALRALGISDDQFRELAARERHELDRRVDLYRHGRPLPHLTGAEVVIVDDGLATGVTAEAAVLSVRAGGPRRIVVAAPVAARDTATRIAAEVDDVVVVAAPARFHSVGEWYDDFRQTTDDEVIELLAAAISEED